MFTKAPVLVTDTGAILSPVCGSVNVCPAASAASDHELVAGVMSRR